MKANTENKPIAKLKLLLLALILIAYQGFNPTRLNAQNGKLLFHVDSTKPKAIYLKWFFKELVSKEGVNVFRKEINTNQWLKINGKPIVMDEVMQEDELQKDSTLRIFVKIAKENQVENLPGMVLLNLLIKSFESQAFAKFLGISFVDTTAVLGKTYLYQVQNTNQGNSIEIGNTLPVVAGKVTYLLPPSNIKIKADTLNAKIYWKEEKERFYAVDIFRKEGVNPINIKLNNTPIMLSDRNIKDTSKLYHFKDEKLKPNTKYTYTLVAHGMFGQVSVPSNPITITIKDLIPPQPPLNVRRKIKNPNVRLSWVCPSDTSIIGFNIYRSELSDGPYSKINSKLLLKSDTVFTHKTTKTGQYYFKIASIDNSGNEAFSSPTFAEIHDILPPDKPKGVVCIPDTGFIKIQWEPNKEKDLLGYLVYRTSVKNNKNFFVLITPNPVRTNFYIEQLPANAKNLFLYKIIAVDSSLNKSPYSDVSSAKLPDVFPPITPQFKNIESTPNGIKLEWIPNVDSDLHHYTLHKFLPTASDSKKDILEVYQIEAGKNTFLDINTMPNKNIFYYLVAIDSAGNLSRPSTTVSGKGFINDLPKTLDKKSFSIKLDKSSMLVNINWKYPSSIPIKGTVIYRKEGENGILMPYTSSITTTGFVDTKIKKNIVYGYMLKIFTTQGTSYNSTIQSFKLE
jgi:fibronectin type 3 domain-containing protein